MEKLSRPIAWSEVRQSWFILLSNLQSSELFGNDPTKTVSALLESLARDGRLCKFLLCLDGGNSNQILEDMDWS